MGKNQHWFTYPHLVIARIPSGSRLSPVITWKFDISLLQPYYTTISHELITGISLFERRDYVYIIQKRCWYVC